MMQAFHVPLFLCASDAWRCSPPRPLCPRPRGTWDAGAELVPIERRGQSGLRVAGSTTDRPRAWHVSEQQWLMRPLARWYQNNVSHELAKYGEFLLCVCATARSWIPGGWIVWRLLGSLTGRVRLSKCLIRSAAPWRLLPLLRRPPSAPCLITHQFAAGCAVCRAQAG